MDVIPPSDGAAPSPTRASPRVGAFSVSVFRAASFSPRGFAPFDGSPGPADSEFVPAEYPRPSAFESEHILATPACALSQASLSSNPNPNRCTSIERMHFWNASLNVLPMAIASPTDFICVVRVSSESGNFSNVHRGIFTTT